MAATVVDDHLLREILVGRLDETLRGRAPDGVAVTGLWLFRLCSSFADPSVVGKLSGPVVALPEDLQERFRAQLVALPDSIEVLSDPKYAGHVGWRDDAVESVQMAALATGQDMNNPAEETAMAIERTHPGWVCWALYRATQPVLYCARRAGESLAAHRSEDPAELADLIEKDES